MRRAVSNPSSGNVAELVSEVARRVRSPFFSVDVVETQAGELVVIELGDGQVSDRKNWTAQKFAVIAEPGAARTDLVADLRINPTPADPDESPHQTVSRPKSR